jgi:hypothetical protein
VASFWNKGDDTELTGIKELQCRCMTLTFRLSDVTGYAAIAELFGVLTF